MHYSLMGHYSQETLMSLFIDGLHKKHALFIETSQETLMHYSLIDFTRNFNALFIDGLHQKL